MMMKNFIVSCVVSNMNRTVFNRTFSTSVLTELLITCKDTRKITSQPTDELPSHSSFLNSTFLLSLKSN